MKKLISENQNKKKAITTKPVVVLIAEDRLVLNEAVAPFGNSIYKTN